MLMMRRMAKLAVVMVLSPCCQQHRRHAHTHVLPLHEGGGDELNGEWQHDVLSSCACSPSPSVSVSAVWV